MADITAERCADSFVEGWVSRFGVLELVTKDRGMQFTSATWACLANKLGFKHMLTSSYHPQANGMVERLHCQIKDAHAPRNFRENTKLKIFVSTLESTNVSYTHFSNILEC
jgi:hypothetical protein